ncbi:histidinol-phosphate transaminase [Spirulina sp. CCNP1310]|uniref:pyridoxal phosphate-dependent aminotransferase n=1 Tax=Spirulina sp. CCNP1310 TaxID=3110249 RepID=UPI002B1F7280|nr:histidinol-phosphate transaminase [Spirulina sp. CCNP1310]MEA5421442.1 histidinol-phosphate transaminase [Spirulina sp. CCNP1310]
MPYYKSWVDQVHRVRGNFTSRLDKIRLDKNERITSFQKDFFNKVIETLRPEHLTAYPEIEPLYSRIAESLGVKREQVVVTAGSDAAIKNCFELCVEPRSKVITISPTFAMVDIYAQLFNALQIKIRYNKQLSLDYAKLLKSLNSEISLIVLANPNSPTGTLIPQEILYNILEKAQSSATTVLIDEAYYGFCKQTVLPLISHFENLVVARTFSKSAGLAGCRIGYLVAQERLAQRLYKFRPMYEVNAIAVMIASAILENPEIVNQYLEETEKGKSYVIEVLNQLKINYLDTHTNFLHFDCGVNYKRLMQAFNQNGILVKGGLGISGYENYLRLTTGPIEVMQPAAKIIQSVLGN